MSEFSSTINTDVEELLRNVELRDELEPFFDEAVSRVVFQRLPLSAENDFLASMLEWEHAPVEAIYRWFEPELRLPSPDSLSDERLSLLLQSVVETLFEKKIQLDFTDHLSDRELYTIIYRGILPSREKNLKRRSSFIHWDCTAGDSPKKLGMV